jgi:hypothetical protein
MSSTSSKQMTDEEFNQKIEQKIGDRLVELMLEDDPDMKKRLKTTCIIS